MTHKIKIISHMIAGTNTDWSAKLIAINKLTSQVHILEPSDLSCLPYEEFKQYQIITSDILAQRIKKRLKYSAKTPDTKNPVIHDICKLLGRKDFEAMLYKILSKAVFQILPKLIDAQQKKEIFLDSREPILIKEPFWQAFRGLFYDAYKDFEDKLKESYKIGVQTLSLKLRVHNSTESLREFVFHGIVRFLRDMISDYMRTVLKSAKDYKREFKPMICQVWWTFPMHPEKYRVLTNNFIKLGGSISVGESKLCKPKALHSPMRIIVEHLENKWDLLPYNSFVRGLKQIRNITELVFRMNRLSNVSKSTRQQIGKILKLIGLNRNLVSLRIEMSQFPFDSLWDIFQKNLLFKKLEVISIYGNLGKSFFQDIERFYQQVPNLKGFNFLGSHQVINNEQEFLSCLQPYSLKPDIVGHKSIISSHPWFDFTPQYMSLLLDRLPKDSLKHLFLTFSQNSMCNFDILNAALQEFKILQSFVLVVCIQTTSQGNDGLLRIPKTLKDFKYLNLGNSNSLNFVFKGLSQAFLNTSLEKLTLDIDAPLIGENVSLLDHLFMTFSQANRELKSLILKLPAINNQRLLALTKTRARHAARFL